MIFVRFSWSFVGFWDCIGGGGGVDVCVGLCVGVWGGGGESRCWDVSMYVSVSVDLCVCCCLITL